MEAPRQAPHVVVLSFAEQGHTNSLMHLSRKLASYGCFITFVLPQNQVPTHSSHPNVHFQGVDDNLPPERPSRGSITDSIDSMINMQAGVRNLLHRLHQLKFHPVSFIIADNFVTWSLALASHFSIPCISYFITHATSCALCFAVPSLLAKGVLPFPRDDKGTLTATQPINLVSGLPPLLPEDLPRPLTFDSSHSLFKFFVDVSETFRSATAVIVNTFEELDGTALTELRKERPCYAVCPLITLSGAPPRLDVSHWQEDEGCLHWLDAQKPTSVLYIAFGSVSSLPATHLKELALGIEASGQPFLWVIRPGSLDSSLDDSLPDGFMHRTKDRGIVISWAPQVRVLSHPSVGGFLTHGGWSSVVENLSTGGVPMICWPLGGDQRMNRRVIVDQWKISMEFRHKEDGMVAKAEVEKVVRCMMQEEEGKDMRKLTQKVRDAACKKASDEGGGSSGRNLQSLLESLDIPFPPFLQNKASCNV